MTESGLQARPLFFNDLQIVSAKLCHNCDNKVRPAFAFVPAGVPRRSETIREDGDDEAIDEEAVERRFMPSSDFVCFSSRDAFLRLGELKAIQFSGSETLHNHIWLH